MAEQYTKDDYLTALRYAKLYNLSPKVVEKAMKIAHIRRASIKLTRGAVPREIVIHSHDKYHVRPGKESHQKLMEIIQEIQSKGVEK